MTDERRTGGTKQHVPAPGRSILVGLAGTGTVGQAVLEIIGTRSDLIRSRSGVEVDIHSASYRSEKPSVEGGFPEDRLTTDIFEIARDPDVDVFVELIGGTDDALEVVREALEHGKQVVTANKVLLAKHGSDLFDLAREQNTSIHFEGAIAGGIPIVSSIKRGFVTETFQSAYGILNGTSNFVLSQMEEGCSYEFALGKAHKKGIAEADPTLDVSGQDAAEKLSLLLPLLYDIPIPDEVYTKGITNITRGDLEYAEDLGYTVKPLALSDRDGDKLQFSVRPALIPSSHELASVRDEHNAFYLEGDQIGPSMFYGLGAGAAPTGAIVVGDIVRAAREIHEGPVQTGRSTRDEVHIQPPEEHSYKFYIRFGVMDRVGILSRISGLLASHDISISGAWAKGTEGEVVSLVMTTHASPGRAVWNAVQEVDNQPGLVSSTSLVLPIIELNQN